MCLPTAAYTIDNILICLIFKRSVFVLFVILREFRDIRSGFGYIVRMRSLCNFVNMYTKLVNVYQTRQ